MARLFVLLIALLTSQVLPAQTPGFSFGKSGAANTQASLLPEVTAIAPGKPFSVALKLAHPSGWHSYYQNSGGVENPPTLTWTLPPGFTARPIQWPVPEVKDGDLGKSFIYSGSPVFLVEITPPPTLKPGESVTLEAAASWQICQKTCRNESAKFSLTLPVVEMANLDPAQATLFAEGRTKLPQPMQRLVLTKVTHNPSRNSFEIELTRPNGNAQPKVVEFIPDQPFVKALSDGGSVIQTADKQVLTLKQALQDPLENLIPVGDFVSGIVVWASPLDRATNSSASRLEPVSLKGVLIDGGGPAAAPPPAKVDMLDFGKLLCWMALGGLILNLMPCVFPVIGLKILGFVQQAGEDRKKVVAHGLTFTLGVLISFWVISGILFVVRTAALAKGGSPDVFGWGYQLQNPLVVLSLMLLMFALALNLFGVFEIGAAATSIGGSLQARKGLLGTLFSGILATVVATPCSAPFLGSALGIAITLPGPQFFTAFTAMGLGLALPYLVLSAFPKLIAFLPRPGAWMESFKQALAFLLFATAGYLLWVYTGQIGIEHMLGPVFGLSLAGLAAWIYGRWALPHRSRRVRMTATLLALAFATGGVLASLPPKPSKLVWQTWSEERVESLLKEGKPVFVDFTAQWCATCQVNKKRAYTPEVIERMEKLGIVALRADKTNSNPAIEKKLTELQRTAIPVNVFYRPGKEPVVTPELLNADYLLELFKQ